MDDLESNLLISSQYSSLEKAKYIKQSLQVSNIYNKSAVDERTKSTGETSRIPTTALSSEQKEAEGSLMEMLATLEAVLCIREAKDQYEIVIPPSLLHRLDIEETLVREYRRAQTRPVTGGARYCHLLRYCCFAICPRICCERFRSVSYFS